MKQTELQGRGTGSPSTSRFRVPMPPNLLYAWCFPPFWLFWWMLIGPLTTWCVTVTEVSRLGLFTVGGGHGRPQATFWKAVLQQPFPAPSHPGLLCPHLLRLLAHSRPPEGMDFLVLSLPLQILVSDRQHSRDVLGIGEPVVSVSKRQMLREMCSGRMACGASW